MPYDDGTPVGIEMNDDEMATLLGHIGESGFSDTKIVYMKAACQNFVFSCAQMVQLISELGFEDDKMDALDAFRDRLSDPAEVEALGGLFDDDEDMVTEATGVLSGFTAAEAREMAEFPIEDDGVRSDDELDRFVAAIEEASFSDDKVAVALSEIEEHPSPPLSAEQLGRVLDCYSHSDDSIKVLEAFTGPKIVYPMNCEEVIGVLDKFSMSSDKIAVLPALKPFIKDAHHKTAIVASFTFSSDKEEAEEILRDLEVDLVPPVPPEEVIQEALARIGCCPSGYPWRQVAGGWRCAAGGHYVSDATLQEAIDG